MIKNIFITGKPGCGKTTLIKEILKEIKIQARGFHTEEIRQKGERVGFKIITLSGKEGILSHKEIESPLKVSKYKVNLKDLEKIGIKEIEKGLKEDCLIVIDEIGKMELFSKKFKKVIKKTLESKNKVLGTIKLTLNSFTERIRKRKDTKILNLTKENREEIKREIIKFLEST